MSALAAARDLLFGDVLACEEVRMAAFVPGLPGEPAQRAFATRGEALLRALAVIEDGARIDEGEQSADHSGLHRLEAKLDLLTLLVAEAVAAAGDDRPRVLRWSARGACLGVDAAPEPGSRGLFRVRPADWLPTPLLLPAAVLACDHDEHGQPRAWLGFEALPPALEAALERHLFRIHRRAIAESRRPR